MRHRKTVEVAAIAERVNAMLALQDEVITRVLRENNTPEQAFRIGIAHLLEGILHETGNYRGYNYQASEFLPEAERRDDTVLRDGYDETRRIYYTERRTTPRQNYYED